jgi:hypothetical protein
MVDHCDDCVRRYKLGLEISSLHASLNQIRNRLLAQHNAYAQAQSLNFLKAKGYKNTVTPPAEMTYEPNTLPHPDWHWEGAMAGADGFNGGAYVANVAQDPQGQLWVFTRAGRYRVHREQFASKMISAMKLEGLPLTLDPAED